MSTAFRELSVKSNNILFFALELDGYYGYARFSWEFNSIFNFQVCYIIFL